MKTKQFSVNILALPNELVEWACEFASKNSLFMAAISLFPNWTILDVDPCKLTLVDLGRENSMSGCRQIWLATSVFNKDGKNYIEIMAKNPNRLDISLPTQTKEGLRAGSVGTVLADTRSLKMWVTAINDLKSKSLAGMWVVNPRTGDRGYYKNERYTAKVERLAQNGLKLLPVAGTNVMQIGAEPEPDW